METSQGSPAIPRRGNAPAARIIVPLVVMLALVVAILATWRLAPSSWFKEPPKDANFSVVFCNRCNNQVEVGWGKNERCSHCGNRLVACGICGKPFGSTDGVAWDEETSRWLCESDFASEKEIRALLKKLDEPGQNVPLPESDETRAARAEYERRIREALRSGKPANTVFLATDRVDKSPESVKHASEYYVQVAPPRSGARTEIYQWSMGNGQIFIVRCAMLAGYGSIEVFNSEGKPLGYARTFSECPIWMTRGVVRKSTLTGDSVQTRNLMAETLQRFVTQ